jgi:hypothetical protein
VRGSCLQRAVLGSACAVAREPLLVTVPQAGVKPVAHLDSIFDYRMAAATVVSIVQSDLEFAPFPVTFKFLPDRDAFEKALLEAGYDTALARSVATTMTAVGGHRGVLLNDDRFSSLPWPGRIAMLAHELGHTVQLTFPQWVKASGQTDATTYFLSFLSVDFLLERHGVPVVLAYFKRFASSQDRVGNFRSAFGEDLQTFEAAVAGRVWKR